MCTRPLKQLASTLMGKRGPKSKLPSGNGSLTSKGYVRIQYGGRLRMEHDVVWEQANGPIPDRHDVHHINHIKHDNRLENLGLKSKTDHKRHHSGCKQLDDRSWLKPCTICRKFKLISIEFWYLSRDGWPLYGRCRVCHIAKVVKDKQARRLRRVEQTC